MTVSLVAQIDAWTAKTEARTLAVFRQSSQSVIDEMQKPVAAGGNMPIDTGFLRSSIQVSVNGAPAPTNRKASGGKHVYNPTIASLAIAGAKLGDRIVVSYSAVYAPFVEYGAQGRAPRGFVRTAALQWPAIVVRVTAQAKVQAAGNIFKDSYTPKG